MFDKEYYLERTRAHEAEFCAHFPDTDGFAIDGPNDTSLWSRQEHRVLFLLKETYGKSGNCICMDSHRYNTPNKKKNFHKNPTNRKVSQLAHGIQNLLSGKPYTPVRGLDEVTLSMSYRKAAKIEIKKSSNQSSKTTNRKKLLQQAEFSADFIRWQIEYLNPTAVVCCGKDVSTALTKFIWNTKKGIREYNGIRVFHINHPGYPGMAVNDVVRDFYDETTGVI